MMDIRRFAIPLVTSLVVGVAVYALSLAGQQSLRAELEQLSATRSDVDKRFAEVDALVSRLESIDLRVAAVEKTLPSAPAPAPEPAPAAEPAPAPAPAPAAPAPASPSQQ
jgi:hypothetical protein